MRVRPVVGNLGSVLKLYSGAFLLPALVAFAYEPRASDLVSWPVPANALIFIGMFVASLLVGLGLELIGGKKEFRDYEGYAIVGLSWFLIAGASAVPFVVTGVIRDPASAFFESMSGITTTGFTVLGNPETLPKSLLFWRSFIQFIGGGGVIVLMVAILSKLTSGAVRLMRAEIAGGSVTRLKPKIAATAKILWGVYAGVTVIVALAIAAILATRHGHGIGDALFEGFLWSFTTISTGGFAPSGASAGVYGDWLFEMTILAGMLIGSVSFSLTFIALQGRPGNLFRDPEFRVFIGIYAAFTLLITLVLLTQAHATFSEAAGDWQYHKEAWVAMGIEDPQYNAKDTVTALRYAAFQAGTFQTSAGFNTINYDLWPDAARVLLILLTFAGGMYGSTAGGPKAFRILILSKAVWREVMRIVHPRAQIAVRVRGNIVPEDVIRGVTAFFFAYLLIFTVTTVVISIYVEDFITAVSTAASTIGNTGTAMGFAGPTSSFADFNPVLKVFLSIVMWFGRLEIFAALVLFFPASYSR